MNGLPSYLEAWVWWVVKTSKKRGWTGINKRMNPAMSRSRWSHFAGHLVSMLFMTTSFLFPVENLICLDYGFPWGNKYLSLAGMVRSSQVNVFSLTYIEKHERMASSCWTPHLCVPAAITVANCHGRGGLIQWWEWGCQVTQLPWTEHIRLPDPSEHIIYVHMHADSATCMFPQLL